LEKVCSFTLLTVYIFSPFDSLLPLPILVVDPTAQSFTVLFFRSRGPLARWTVLGDSFCLGLLTVLGRRTLLPCCCSRLILFLHHMVTGSIVFIAKIENQGSSEFVIPISVNIYIFPSGNLDYQIFISLK